MYTFVKLWLHTCMRFKRSLFFMFSNVLLMGISKRKLRFGTLEFHIRNALDYFNLQLNCINGSYVKI